jgi:TorA maturation chaperone TorD
LSQIAADVSQEDVLRADLYDFLAALLARPPGADLIARSRALTGDETALGRAIGALARVAGQVGRADVAREFDRLFIGLGRGELVPYASFYMTGFLNERPLAALRGDMARLGIGRAPNVYEPEDNIASLCEMMAALITGRFGPPAPLSVQRDFHGRHLAPWAGLFFADLERAQGAFFYAPVGAIGTVFMEIEKQAFRMAAAAGPA